MSGVVVLVTEVVVVIVVVVAVVVVMVLVGIMIPQLSSPLADLSDLGSNPTAVTSA